MTVTTRWTGVGRGAFEAMVAAVAAAQGDDPLRPLTVVAPSAPAVVALRRALARQQPTAAVTFSTIDGLAEHLAAPVAGVSDADVGVDRALVVAAVRAELVRHPGRFGAIVHHRSTWEQVAVAVEELAGTTPAARAAIAARGGLGADVVRVHDAIAASVGIGGRIARFDAAIARLDDSDVAPDPVIVVSPDALDAPASRLLVRLAASTDVVVIGGLVGVAALDDAGVDAVIGIGGTAPAEVVAPQTPPVEVISANDIDDEIGAAVRTVLAAAEHDGVALHRIALVHPGGSPYARAVAETLRAAGVPFSGPSTETSAHAAAGRVLLAVLAVAASGFSRESVVALWSTGVLLGPDAAPLGWVALDERSRRLGIVGGRDAWRARIEARVEHLSADAAADPPGAEPDPDRDRRDGHRRRELHELATMDQALSMLEEWVDSVPTRWEDVAQWVDDVLDDACGVLPRRVGWPEWELDAEIAIRTRAARLGALAAVDAEPGAAVVVDTVRATLDEPAPRRSKAGTGLTVATLDQPPTTLHDVVVVVGLAEGHVPHVRRDDVLLDEVDRAVACLGSTTDHTARQHRSLLATLAAATERTVVTYARCDQRSGRTQVPSRWLIDLIDAAGGGRPRSEALMSGAPVPGVRVIHSHAAAVAGAVDPGHAALHPEEYVRAHLAGADFDAHPAVLDTVVQAGSTLLRSRRANAFTRFDGNLDGAGHDVVGAGRHLSPTSLERFATCPRRWFFGHGLGVGVVDRPEAIDKMLPRDKGTLTHHILEVFFGTAIEAGTVPPPGQPWPADVFGVLADIAEEAFADFERRGLTGHPKWWAFDRAEIWEVVVKTVIDDVRVRAEHQAMPVAVELTFGRDGIAPLDVPLADGRVIQIAGQADRVDTTPRGVMVHDYKYSSTAAFDGLDKPIDAGGDPLAGGTHLQLLAYAEAAASQRGVDQASAWYWFLKPGTTGRRIGYEVTAAHRAIFRETLRTLVDGITQGYYPARSGPASWFLGTNENCGFCDFRSICPDDREEEWERVKHHPALADLLRLADEGAPALLAEPEDDA